MGCRRAPPRTPRRPRPARGAERARLIASASLIFLDRVSGLGPAAHDCDHKLAGDRTCMKYTPDPDAQQGAVLACAQDQKKIGKRAEADERNHFVESAHKARAT